MSRGGPNERGGSIPTVSAIVVAAGRGVRMHGADKIFDPLPGARDKPALAFSVDVLEASPHVDAIVLVVSADRVSRCETLAGERGWSKVAGVWPGGDRRQDSVAAGLSRLPDAEWVVVHDGARPFLSAEMLVRGLCAARQTGGLRRRRAGHGHHQEGGPGRLFGGHARQGAPAQRADSTGVPPRAARRGPRPCGRSLH